MSLRLILLLIGIGLIAAIWLWDYWSKKRASQQRHSDVVFNHELKTDSGYRADDPDSEFESLPGKLRSDEVSNDPELFKLGISAKHRDETDQFPLVLHDVIESDDKPVTSNEVEGGGGEAGDVTEDELLVLVITPSGSDHFGGLEILSATRHAGLKFGRMNIFHSYGVGDMNLDEPLFSLANLYEPGEFNLEEMESFSTRGLVIYMTLPTAIEPEISLEIMLNTAQRIAESLGGIICDPQRQPLTDDELEKMRGKMKRFQTV